MKHHLLTFRGAELAKDQIDIWFGQSQKNESISIPSMISTSENIQVALKFAQSTSIEKKPVLIIFYARNS